MSGERFVSIQYKGGGAGVPRVIAACAAPHRCQVVASDQSLSQRLPLAAAPLLDCQHLADSLSSSGLWMPEIGHLLKLRVEYSLPSGKQCFRGESAEHSKKYISTISFTGLRWC